VIRRSIEPCGKLLDTRQSGPGLRAVIPLANGRRPQARLLDLRIHSAENFKSLHGTPLTPPGMRPPARALRQAKGTRDGKAKPVEGGDGHKPDK
jgi:hypothetical protein